MSDEATRAATALHALSDLARNGWTVTISNGGLDGVELEMSNGIEYVSFKRDYLAAAVEAAVPELHERMCHREMGLRAMVRAINDSCAKYAGKEGA